MKRASFSPDVVLAFCAAVGVAAGCAGSKPAGAGNPEQISTAEYDLARDAFQGGKLREALEHINKSLEQDSDNAEAAYLGSLIQLQFCGVDIEVERMAVPREAEEVPPGMAIRGQTPRKPRRPGNVLRGGTLNPPRKPFQGRRFGVLQAPWGRKKFWVPLPPGKKTGGKTPGGGPPPQGGGQGGIFCPIERPLPKKSLPPQKTVFFLRPATNNPPRPPPVKKKGGGKLLGGGGGNPSFKKKGPSKNPPPPPRG